MVWEHKNLTQNLIMSSISVLMRRFQNVCTERYLAVLGGEDRLLLAESITRYMVVGLGVSCTGNSS